MTDPATAMKLAQFMIARDEGQLENTGIWFEQAVTLARAYIALASPALSIDPIVRQAFYDKCSICGNFFDDGCNEPRPVNCPISKATDTSTHVDDVIALGKTLASPTPESSQVAPHHAGAREWLVIESSMKNAVFADDELRQRRGYIPRDVAEKLLGRDLGGSQWFTTEDSAKMRDHSEWQDIEPSARATPSTPGEDFSKLAAIRARHEAAEREPASIIALEKWLMRYGAAAHHDRATLLSLIAARAPVQKTYEFCPICGQKNDANAHCSMGGCPIGGDF